MILLLLAAFLFPLAIYFLILGMINRRQHPLLVSGTWDFVGVLFAASGFLLLGGPAIIATLNERWQLFRLSNAAAGDEGTGTSWSIWLAVWVILAILYVGLIVSVTVLMLRNRRKQTSIYNIDPGVFDDIFGRVLHGLGMTWDRAGNEVFITGGNGVGGDGVQGRLVETSFQASATPGPRVLGRADGSARAGKSHLSLSGGPDETALFVLEQSPTLRHITLRWASAAGTIRPQVEDELRRALSEMVTWNNPLGVWLLCLSAILFGSAFFAVLLLLFLAI